jgi:cytochrome c2
VPSLLHAERFRRAWVAEFLLEPHDLRPGLVAQMPRLAITRAEAERIAAHLVPVDAASDLSDAAEGDIARGEQLYRSLTCGRCHRFSGTGVDDEPLHARGRTDADGSWALAPDLRHARTRMEQAQLAAWITNPRGSMPATGVALADARDLAAFIARAPLADPPPRAPASRLAVLSRAVTWDEVETKVFKRLCWHCHASPDLARGDGGPGTSGGFGFGPRGLDLSSYAAISSGSLDDAGEPRSVFGPVDGTPRLVLHLWARHVEEAGGVVPGIRGMPLGLPALPLDQIQLIETWIAQGRPR